jgi:hypothetical protein
LHELKRLENAGTLRPRLHRGAIDLLDLSALDAWACASGRTAATPVEGQE